MAYFMHWHADIKRYYRVEVTRTSRGGRQIVITDDVTNERVKWTKANPYRDRFKLYEDIIEDLLEFALDK